MILGLIFDRFLVDFGIENRWKIDEKSIKKQIKKGASKTDQAKLVGAEIAKVAQEKGIKIVCFDRNGFIYHGRIRALAEAARDAGLDF